MTKYLVDTCVWRDFFEDRLGTTGRPLGKYATEFFSKTIKNKDEIIFSKYLVEELRIHYTEEEIYDSLNIFIIIGLLKKIDTTKDEKDEAKKLSAERNIPLADCIYAVQARNHDAILVSQDRHFQKLSDITKIRLP